MMKVRMCSLIFFFKQKTAYEMRISDWSSDVCSSDLNKLLGRLAFPTIDEGHACAHEVKPRLKMMDEMGVYAQICFHNSGVTQAGSLMSLGDPELALAIIRMYNDAARNRQQESGDRLFTLAHLDRKSTRLNSSH